MNCPKCQSAMQPVKVEGIEVDRCTACQGLWFDALEDRDLRKRKGGAAVDVGDAGAGSERDAQGKIHCPRCRTPMVRMVDREQPHVWFESCSVCHGRFFDAGEFRDVATRGISDVFKKLRKGERPLS